MVAVLPTSDDWRYEGVSEERLRYLNASVSFEEILARIDREGTVRSAKIDPGRDSDVQGGIRPIFEVSVTRETSDLFFNGPDGYRGKYWQGTEIGQVANRQVIEILTPRLLAHPKDKFKIIAPARMMALPELEKSLQLPSAKVWIGAEIESIANATGELIVRRWRQNQLSGKLPQSAALASRPMMSEILDVKGAFLTGEGIELVQLSKKDRANQIHLGGWS